MFGGIPLRTWPTRKDSAERVKKLTKLFNGKKHEYLNGIEYDDDVFQFINTEEGRARPMGTSGINNQEYVYDYFLKDHLGNIRVILSSEVTRERYFATMENQNASVEEQTFENIPETRDDLPFGYPVDSTYSPNQKVSVLNKVDNKTIGHAKVLEVKQGMKLDFDTKYFFTGNSFVLGSTTPINDILSQLANVFILSPASSIAGDELAKKQQWAQQTFINNSDVSTFLSSSLSNSDPDFLNKPKAFLVWIFFDKSFKFIPEASGVKQVFNADQLGELAVLEQDIPENGYFYIYVSNESEKEVNFDNLRISQTSGSFVEENHYYPFGMLIEDLSTDVSKGQKYKYNGKELQTDLNYNVEDYCARQYDPVIARWMHMDPLAEKYRRWSPYNYAVDNPVRFIDPDGRQIVPVAYNKDKSISTFLKATYNQFGDKVGYQIQMAMGGQSSQKDFNKALKSIDKPQREMATKLFNIAGDKDKTVFIDVIKPTAVTMNQDGITIDRNATGNVREKVPNTQQHYPTGYENSTMPTPFDASPIDASSITPGTQGSYSVSEPDKSRGLVITTSESKDLSPQQETDMINSVIKANDDITPTQPK